MKKKEDRELDNVVMEKLIRLCQMKISSFEDANPFFYFKAMIEL